MGWCFTTTMRRFLRKFAFSPVILILAGFVWFTLEIAEPLQKAERKSLVTGTIHPAAPLRPDGPLIPYVALHKGVPGPRVPEFPLDDEQPEGDGDGAFELSADERDGRRFYLLARIETAKQERFCEKIALPRMRRAEDGVWLQAATGQPLERLRITVDKSQPCD